MNLIELLELGLIPAEPFYTVYDDGDNDTGSDDTGDTDDKIDDSTGGDTGGNKTFTQDDVNRIVSKEKAEAKRQMQKRIAELEKFKSTAKLSQEELKTLETQIGDMQKQIETKEEQVKREREISAKKHQRELQGLTEERDSWKNRYTQSIIQRSLTDAAVSANAFNPEQVVAILRPNTEVVEEVDQDGKTTGRYKAQTSYNTVDEKGQPITVVEDPAKIVKRMMDTEECMNLFKSDKAGGLGMRTTTTRKSKGVPKDTAEYIKMRAEERKNRNKSFRSE